MLGGGGSRPAWINAATRPSSKLVQVEKIMSGGQTGVDQAALRAGLACGIAIGGWCPPGRVCDDGLIPETFILEETPDDRSASAPEIPRSQRSEWNVRDSDATLILRPLRSIHEDDGTRWTAECASAYGRPTFICDPGDAAKLERVRQWIADSCIHILNVAGPSEATSPGIGTVAERFILALLSPNA
jgi:hypothetical protein